MRTYFLNVLILLFLILNLYGQSEEIITLKTETGEIEGTILIPESTSTTPVVLIIAGSGPVDRDGNNPMMKNNSLKMLAYELYMKEISSVRYDKRGVGKSKISGLKESDLRFEHYISDAKGWISLLKDNQKFDQIIVIGHSEGSLIGMIASQNQNVDKFISIAGIGQTADKTIQDQLNQQPASVLEQAIPILDSLANGKKVENVPQMLYPLFRPSVQSYMISWFKYDPQVEIKKLKKPVLIIQGTSDIQVTVEDAKRLSKADPKAKLALITGMNHVLKQSVLERQKNIQTYNQPDLPVKDELVKTIVDFINEKN